jgi:hypothetical protein
MMDLGVETVVRAAEALIAETKDTHG